MAQRAVRVGNGQGFWGDSARGPKQLAAGGGIDYLTMDFLAEVTMSILQKQRRKDPSTGYASDFVRQLSLILDDVRAHGITVIANAGGVNLEGCLDAVSDVVRAAGHADVTLASVEGDDVLPVMRSLIESGIPFRNLDTGEDLAPHADRLLSANVYLGAAPIVEALAQGADIVVTGRVTDASMTVAAAAHEHGWSLTDWDQLASATVAGHIIECGTQCTGGNFSGWRQVTDWTDIGFPIVEIEEDGSFVVTKQPGTGGMVTVDTVTAQLLYEIGDPARYVTADVVSDFTAARLEQVGPDRVRVSGVRGAAATDQYKVSISLDHGWRVSGQLTVGAPAAADKARLTADILFSRLAASGVAFAPEDVLVEMLGAGALYPGMGIGSEEPPEVVLRISVRSADRRPLAALGDEFASLLTSGPPGLTGFAGGRPRPSQVAGFWPALAPRSIAAPVVRAKKVA